MFITHNPLIPIWRTVLGSLLLFLGAVAVPAFHTHIVATRGLTPETEFMLVTGVMQFGGLLTTSQMITALPARILLRLRGGPRETVSPEDLMERLTRAAFMLAAWKRAMGVKNRHERLGITFDRATPGNPVQLQVYWPFSYVSDPEDRTQHPMTDYLKEIIMGTEDSRAFDAYAENVGILSQTTPTSNRMADLVVPIPDSASLSNHAVLEADAILHKRGLLKLPPPGFPP